VSANENLKISIEKLQGDKLIFNINRFIQKTPELRTAILLESADTFIRDLQSFLTFGRGRRSGNYAESWKIKELDSNHATVATPYGYLLIILEFGTKPHPITPKESPVLVFKGKDGSIVFAMYVRHPGTPPIPHFEPTKQLLKIKMPEIVKRAVERTWKAQ
jgi:hypothetical protein